MDSAINNPFFSAACFGIDNIIEYKLQCDLYTYFKQSTIGYDNKILANTRIYFALKLTAILIAELFYYTNKSSLKSPKKTCAC